MRISLHHYFHLEGENELLAELDNLRCALQTLGAEIMAELTDLQTKVAANTDVVDSAVELLDGLKTKLDEAIASGSPAALQALSDELGSSNAQLAEAVAKNTPAATPPATP